MEITGSILIHPEELDREWIAEAVRLGIPRIGLHPVGGTDADKSMAELLERLKTDSFRTLLDEAAEKNIEIEYEMHSARYLLPASEFSEHPGWFRMNAAGKRTADFNCCPSNDEALAYIARRARNAARQLYRSTHRFFFWMDDARDTACHCPACSKLTPSDQQLLVMNAILAEIRKDLPDARLAYLAYADCSVPPVSVKPADGIFLEYAPFGRDIHAPINSPVSEVNRSHHAVIENLLSFFGTQDAKLLEYWIDNSMFSLWKKPPKQMTEDSAVIHADARYYRSVGFHDLSTFACYLGADYRALYGMPDISAVAEEIHCCN